MSNTHVLLFDPHNRRCWLLIKALEENVSLGQALQLAQAADEFLMGTVPRVAGFERIHQSKATPESDVHNEITTEPGAFDAFSSVASVDDILRYLRQCGEIVPENDGKFLDDCVSENAGELLARANRVRTQEGLPHFTFIPSVDILKVDDRGKSAPTGKVASKRPPSARERAQWARQVVGLPS